MVDAKEGKCVVVEGLEGAGKSTAVQFLSALLSKHRIQSITTREPGGTVIGETLRELIKNKKHDALDDRSELLLLYASRIQLLEEVIKPALKKGTWVIADRFELSSYAYQGGGRGLDEAMINHLSAFCLRGFKPHLTLYLDIGPQLGIKRVDLRGQLDRIEQQSIDFFMKIHQHYMKQLKAHPDIIRIDAGCSLEEVQANIEVVMECFIRQTL